MNNATPVSVAVSPVSLRLNFIWTMAGNSVFAAAQWGVLVLLARLGNPESVGKFALGMAISTPIMQFANLQLRGVQATDARGQFAFSDYCGVRLILTTVAGLAICTIGLGWYRGDQALIICMFAASKGIESFSDIIYGLWQQHENLRSISQSLMLRGLVSLLAVGITYYRFHSVLISVLSMAVVWAGVLMLHDLPNAATATGHGWRAVVPRFHFPDMREMVLIAWPLGVVVLFVSLNVNIPRYVISHILGVRELGIYSALAYMLMAGTMVVNSVGQAAVPRLSQYFAYKKIREFHKLSNQLLLIGAGLGVSGVLIAIVAGRLIIRVLYGARYSDHPGVLVWVMIAGAFSYLASFAGYSLTAARRFKPQLPMSIAVAATTLVLSVMLVKWHGIVGGVEAIAGGNLVQFVVSMIILRRKSKFDLENA